MALWLPRWLRDEKAPREEPSRRTFLFMGAAAGIVLVSEPIRLFDLSDMPTGEMGIKGFSLEEANRLLRELYTSQTVKNLNDNTLLMKYTEREDPECPYCGEGIATNMARCYACGATLRQVDYGLPEELRKDMEFFRKHTT